MFKQDICYEIWGGESGKYRLRDSDGTAIDQSPEDTCARVARALADVEPADQEKWYKEFVRVLGTRFAGGGRIMANAGAGKYKKETSCINCVVMRQLPDSMLGIMSVATEAALTLKAGCGVGYDFSSIRPKGAHVFGAGAATSGVMSFIEIFNSVCQTVMSGGGRRGAQMGCLDAQHPDIEEFILSKRKDGAFRYFNFSVLITDAFMHAVENGDDWDLWFWNKSNKTKDEVDVKIIEKNDIPYNHPESQYFSFAEDHVECVYSKRTPDVVFEKKVFRTLKANELFELITKSTYNFSDPGFILIDKMNRENNLYFLETIRSTNPCVTGDTLISTNEGLVPAKNLVGKKITVPVDFRMERGVNAETSYWKKTREDAQILKLQTKEGYSIKATPDHRIMTNDGWKELQNLSPGDKVHIYQGNGAFGSKGSFGEGAVFGWLVGDGTITGQKAVLSFWGEEEHILAKSMAKYASKMVANETSAKANRSYDELCAYSVEERNESRVASVRLRRIVEREGLVENKLQVPPSVWAGTEAMQRGFLSGLFSADGTVGNKNSVSVRLSSTSPDLLSQVQVLLQGFGIASKIYLNRNPAGYRSLPDGHGGHKEYLCKAGHELIISKYNLVNFMNRIGFLLPYKQKALLNNIDSLNVLGPRPEHFTATVESVTKDGIEDVYDCSVPGVNAFIANGLVIHNCSEQPLSPLSNCLLGSMMLPVYVRNPFTSDAYFDWEGFAKDVRVASRMLDNVIEINNLPLPELEENLRYQRRHGLGFTGLGSVLNMLGIKYNSSTGVAFGEKISKTMAQQSLLESIHLAREKGPAPFSELIENRARFLNSEYNKRLLETFQETQAIIEQVMEYGVRWSHATSLAPTGTMSLTWGNNCSNGLEPVFMNSYLRNIRMPGKKTKTQMEVFDYAYYEWRQLFGDDPLPNTWVTTDDLTIEDHLNMQAAIQKYVDSATSKTINVPTECSYEDFKNVYIEGWKRGLKGVTTYRFNPKITSGVLVRKEDIANTSYVFELEDGEEITLRGDEKVEYDGETHIAANLYEALKEGIYGNM